MDEDSIFTANQQESVEKVVGYNYLARVGWKGSRLQLFGRDRLKR